MIINTLFSLKKQIGFVLNSFDDFGAIFKDEYYNFRCNVCGDSDSNKKKKRGYILFGKSPYVYTCHNCGYTTTAENWLRLYFPENYKSYIKDILNNKYGEEPEIIEDEPKKEKPINKKDFEYFIPIINKEHFDLITLAINFCEQKHIPKEIYNKWYIAYNGKYKNRLIIPFYDNNDKIYYFQARCLFDYMQPKYLCMEGEKQIYNWYNIDKEKPIIILEGPIDSIFLENAVAVLGLNIPNNIKDLLSNCDCYYLFDYDKPGLETSEKYLKKEKYVFLWKKYLRDNNINLNKEKLDINDIYVYLNRKEKFSFKELEPYFSNSFFDKIYL